MGGRYFWAAVLPLALAACGGEQPAGDEGGDISMADAAERMADNAVKPMAGEYRLTVEVLEVNIPGAPANIADMMRQQMAAQPSQYCLTQEQVDKGFEEMARQGQESGDCSFNRFEVSGGSIDAEMVCNAAGQGTMTMTISGEGTPTRSVMETNMQGNMGEMGDMTIKARATHERIGDCPA